MALDPLRIVENVRRASDPDAAWSRFRRELADGGFEDISCYFGVPWSDAFPNARSGRTRFYRSSLLSPASDRFFEQHPEYTRHNPITRHCRTSPRPLVRAGEDPSVPFAATHLRMLDGLRDLIGDVDFNVFPLSSQDLREYGNLTIFTPRTREARRHLQARRDTLHLSGLYFYAAMQARFPGEPAPLPARLSPRQQECLAWVAAGLTSDQIAGRLGLSRKTVDLHLAAAMRKLEASSRAQAAARAVALGLVHP